jgi:hypothetical protein
LSVQNLNEGFIRTVIVECPEFEWGLYKNSHNWVSAVADVRHFEHHTVCQVYLTLGASGLRTVAYLLRIGTDIMRNFAICHHTKSPVTKVVLSKLAKAAVLVTCIWLMLGSHLGGNTKYLTLLFMVCHSCSRQMAVHTLWVLSRLLVTYPFWFNCHLNHETVKWIFCISLPVCKVHSLVGVHTVFSATSLFETDLLIY